MRMARGRNKQKNRTCHGKRVRVGIGRDKRFSVGHPTKIDKSQGRREGARERDTNKNIESGEGNHFPF